ncbi:hypothetical protein BDZ89DRAFT_481690 [Hymenopellis radicata]|nr:hypothetical protein BDZ89DRAFT_481690 [Hymenopellis radicata]
MPDEDSLVNVGASMVGDDEQDQNEFVDLIKKEPGDSKLSIITITPGDGPRTAKEARGGAKKWLINTHIPVEARNAFKHGLLRLFKTCLALSQDPWAALTAKQVQECVDTEFGPNVYQVGPKGAWVGCANYRLGDYRHDFPEIAAKLFLKFIREDNPEHFTGPEDVAEYANWALEKDKGGTAPIHWKTWGGGTKKSGILRNAFIIDMLVQTYYLSLPDIEDPRTAPRPIGLILLSEQAISRELSLWTTGYRLANKQAPQFSKQNYGDITELKNLDPKKYGEGSFKQQNYKRGSFFLKTMLSWTDDKWEAYLTDVMEAVQECRPAKTTAAQPEAIEEDDDIIFASDPPVPDEDVPMADGDGAPAASGPGGTDGDGGNGKGRDEEGGGSMRGEEPRTAEGQGYGDDKDDGENDGEGDEVRVDVAGDGDDVDSEMDIEGDVEADIEGGDGGDDEGGDEDDEEGDEEHGDSTDGGIPVASEDEDTSDSN